MNNYSSPAFFLLKMKFSEVFRAVEIRVGKVYGCPGKIMLVNGLVTAFVHIGPDISLKREVGNEEPDEFQGDSVIGIPPVCSSVGFYIKIFLCV